MFHYCAHCSYGSKHAWFLRRHITKKHPNNVSNVNSNMTYDLDINQEHENLKNDYESLMKQKNYLDQENQDIKNNLSEHQTKMNVHTQRQGSVKEVYQQPGHVLQSKDMIGKGGAYRCGDTALRTQDLKTGQILPNRKRLRPNNDEQSETTSSVDSMEIDKHHKDFFSESDSEESDMDVGSELPDIMGGIEKAFDHNLRCVKDILKH